MVTQNKENDTDINNIHNFNIDIKNREIYLHSYFSESEDEPGVDYRSAVVFEKNLRYLNTLSSDPIVIHMHLPGGMWSDCLGIYDSIRFSSSKTIIIGYGSVESASSIIFQSANLRVLMPNTTMLIHYGSFSVNEEHSKAAASSIAWNEKECDKMINIFVDKCVDSDMAKNKHWKKLIAKKHIMSQLANKCDWILTAEEAMGYNFADSIFGSKGFSNIDELKYKAKRK
jgi:ATP-dependent protease ClpP protease subunit